ncbi:MAG: TIGR03621 family F420-dependent LLM class oxidoreductase, partial [Myxococcales bacterium]|nr:TIGR03621 family F420-dependent LLM class oxidoreductase [Myxococcales bacterium]
IDYRPAAVLAMEATTLDLLSEGRLELGLGAGWLRGEYEAAGLRFDPAGTRIDRLEETVRAFKLFCSGEPLSIEGEHVRWQGFSGIPRPVQRPHPPLMIGGGSRRVLELAAREAQVVSLNFNNRSGVIGADGMHSGSAEATQRKVDWVRAAAGSRNESLEIEIGAYFTFVGDAVAGIAEQMAKGLGLSTEDMLAHPHALFGSVDGICEELQRRRERFGISYVTVGAEAIEAFAPVVARLDGQ